jgi:hypothetical protein
MQIRELTHSFDDINISAPRVLPPIPEVQLLAFPLRLVFLNPLFLRKEVKVAYR